MKMKFIKPNRTFAEGGGLTSKLIPYQLDKAGMVAGVGAVAVGGTLGAEMMRRHNQMQLGKIVYTGGPARMTDNFSSGAIEAIQQITKDPEVQADMLKKIVRTQDSVLSNMEEFGVDDQFLSAFYGMGN